VIQKYIYIVHRNMVRNTDNSYVQLVMNAWTAWTIGRLDIGCCNRLAEACHGHALV